MHRLFIKSFDILIKNCQQIDNKNQHDLGNFHFQGCKVEVPLYHLAFYIYDKLLENLQEKDQKNILYFCIFKPSCTYYIGSKRQLSNPEKWPQFGQSGHGNKGPQMHCFFTCKRAKSCLPTLWLYSQKWFLLLWQTLKLQKNIHLKL